MPQSRNLRAERSGAILRNAESRYGAVTKLLHWSVAALILGLIWLGWYMVGLTYYDAWYNDSLAWHKALGIVVLALGALKIGWAFYSQPPAHAATLKRWERFAATVVHGLLYTMMVLIPVTGYLVSTSEGEGVDLWGLFTVPAVFVAGEALRDLAIEAHYWCGYAVGVLALVHAGAALKHQFLDRDGTLRRMLW